MLAVNHEALGERVGYSGVISQIMETYDEPPMGNKGSIVLQIKSISKQYKTGDFVQKALDDVSLNLRDSEFVAILGPSGSGKTTLLNIIGGLDRYDSGDLIINGVSTKRYKDRDWNSYRNHTIGFVFQSYNLIPHQTILSNVELALTISGVSRTERRERARKALEQVGLGDHINKKPNQLSGGQMQRVAIARALVNDPDIVLADEPTGALDSDTSVQIMNLLKEVAKDRLVVMVTHNPELAEQYATRTVQLRDGVIRSDSDPYEVEEGASEAPVHKRLGKASMSLATSIALSFNNLRTKKGRTLLTSFAGSIGIIGIALILSVSTGVNAYIDSIQRDTMTAYPITIDSQTFDMTSIMGARRAARRPEANRRRTTASTGRPQHQADLQPDEQHHEEQPRRFQEVSGRPQQRGSPICRRNRHPIHVRREVLRVQPRSRRHAGHRERRHHRCQVRFDIERCADELDGPVVEHVRHDEHADDGADRQDRHERVAQLVP